MKYVFSIVLIVLSGCSTKTVNTVENKIDVNQLIELNNYRTVNVDSLFQISFPSNFTRTNCLSEDAILQFNDLSREEHLVIFNTSGNSDTVSLKEKLKLEMKLTDIKNEVTETSEYEGLFIENYSCDVSLSNSIVGYSYWLTRYNWSSNSYLIFRWTLHNNKKQFEEDASLIGKTFIPL